MSRAKLSYNLGLELRGSGIHYDPNKGYYSVIEGLGKEYYTKNEAEQIARVLSSERARAQRAGNSAGLARARVKRSFTVSGFKAILTERKQGGFKERQRVRRSMAEEDYVADLLIDAFPKLDREEVLYLLNSEKIAAIMALAISPYSATARLADPEGALAILGLTEVPEDMNVGESDLEE